MADPTQTKATGTPEERVPSYPLRASNKRHLKALVAGLRWSEATFGTGDEFTQEIAAVIRTLEANANSAPEQPGTCYRLRASEGRHLGLLIAALRWSEQTFGTRDAFTLEIGAATRAFEVYEQTHRRSVIGRLLQEGLRWPRF